MRIALWVAAGLVVLAALGLGVTAAALPGCSSCHMKGEFRRESISRSHSAVDCVRCHVKNTASARVTYAAYEILGMALHVVPDEGRSAASVDDSTCLSCHQDINAGIMESGGLRIKHSVCAKEGSCSDCHSATAHGASTSWRRGLSMEACLDCHVPSNVRSPCTTCHTAEKSTDMLMSTGSWSVTHGPSWETAHGMGDWNTCASCHSSDYCARCHHIALPHDADFMRTHGKTASSHRKDCEVCHRTSFCEDCHRMEMPHPADFAPTHGATVRLRGQAVCLRCHDVSDCRTCHVRHVHPGKLATPAKASP